MQPVGGSAKWEDARNLTWIEVWIECQWTMCVWIECRSERHVSLSLLNVIQYVLHHIQQYQSSYDNPISPFKTNHPIIQSSIKAQGQKRGPGPKLVETVETFTKRMRFQRSIYSYSLYIQFVDSGGLNCLFWNGSFVVRCCLFFVHSWKCVWFCGFDGCTNICQRYLTLPTSLPSSEITWMSTFNEFHVGSAVIPTKLWFEIYTAWTVNEHNSLKDSDKGNRWTHWRKASSTS